MLFKLLLYLQAYLCHVDSACWPYMPPAVEAPA